MPFDELIKMAAATSIIVGAFGFAAIAQDKVTERLDDRRMFKSGQDAFDKICSRCHTNRKDTVGPDLLRADAEYDADIIVFFARNGSGPMPAFTESMIDNTTLKELATYVANKGKGAPK